MSAAVADQSAPWPPWTVPVALAGGTVAGQILAFVVVIPFAAFGVGDGDITAFTLLVTMLGFMTGLLGITALLARATTPLTTYRLGLRPTPAVPALAWTGLAVALLAAFALFWSQLVDLSSILDVPAELDGRSALADEFDLSTSVQEVPLSAGAVVSAFARVVVVALVAEIVLRGFALPALIGWRGAWPAVLITALLTAAPLAFAAGGDGDPSLLPIVLVLGTALALLYIVSNSLLPGLALSSLASGFVLGQAYGWTVAGSISLAVGCCAAVLVIGWALVRAR